MKHLLGAFVLIATSYILSHTNVSAQAPSPVSLKVTPAIVDTGGDAGSRVPFSFRVTNESELVLPFHLSARSMRVEESNANSFLQSKSAQGWIQFDEPDFLLGSKKTKTVAGFLAIPKDTGPGGYYADITVKPLTQASTPDIVQAQPELTVRFLVRVAGNTMEQVSARPTGTRFVMTSRPSTQTVRFLLENKGNVHELVRPSLRIANGSTDVAMLTGEPVFLLPREQQTVSFTLPDNLGFGSFSMSLSYAYGTPQKDVSTSGYRLIILPFPPAFLLIIPIGLGMYAVRRYYTRLLLAVRILVKGQAKK